MRGLREAPEMEERGVDYNRSPVVVFWEVTRACALVCLHCRATAQPQRHPQELTTREGFQLIEEIARFPGKPILIFTGGDPLMRRDLFDLMEYAVDRGLRVSLAPSATALVTRARLSRAKALGLSRISFSLDGSCPEVHDAFRGFQGSFQRTLECIRDAIDVGLSLQINTSVTRRNRADLKEVARLVQRTGAMLWDVFFLVPVGRAQREDVISPQEHEEVLNWLYDLSQQVPFAIKTTEAQHYRRVVLQREGFPVPPQGPVGSPGSALPAANDGKGVCFVSHLGEIYPSGFLPLVAGNVRRDSLVEVYQGSALFKELRDPGRLKGKCGYCPFNALCGGSRARAYGFTGDFLEAEPCCVYMPPPP